MEKLILGTRGSRLALAQAEWVRDELRRRVANLEVELRVIKTTGDRLSTASLARLAGSTKGVFVKEIEEALLEGAIDLAVHSLKDLPVEQPAGLEVAAYPRREDPRDALALGDGYRSLADLPSGARVGTSSLRRRVQLLRLRGDLAVEPIRGNVDTRLRKLREGTYAAVTLALAGLRRLGLDEAADYVFPPEEMLPAPGQAALAVEIRSNDAGTRELVALLDDPVTRTAVTAERAFLAALGGGCQVPLGAYARCDGDGSGTLRAFVASPDGGSFLEDEIAGSADQLPELARRLADRFLAAGAEKFLGTMKP
ncbi:MAG: hydroxymethylbilane synthase [Acidobacteriota bacterium]